MKSFEEFNSTITPEILSPMQDEIISNLKKHLEKEPIENPIEESLWFNRSFSFSLTMRILEKYHNWLHED